MDENRQYVDADVLVSYFLKIRAMIVLHAFSLGHILKVGDPIGFSLRLEELELPGTVTWDYVLGNYGNTKPLTDKVWVAMTVRKEDLKAAQQLALDDQLELHPDKKTTAYRYNNPSKKSG